MNSNMSENNQRQDEEENADDVPIILAQQPSERPKKIFLEIALIFLFFGNDLSSTLLTNQMFKQACLQFDYNSSICDNINQNRNNDSNTTEIEKKLQPYIANIQMVTSLVNTLIPAALSLFLGPFSDMYGRKIILMSTFTGYALSLSLYASSCFYSDYINPLSPWVYAFCQIPAILFGGWPSLLTATLCHVTDTSEENKRAFRLIVIESIIFLGVLLGNLSCSLILSVTNATAVFGISATCAIFATLIIIFLVDESINEIRNATVCEKITHLLSVEYLCDMVKTCFKRRPFKERRILLCLITILMLTTFTFNGSSVCGYLFERLKFDWTLKDHNYFISYNIISSMIGSLIGFGILRKWFHFSDLSLICVALVSGLLDSTFKAFAAYPWQMYLISSFTLFRILSSPMSRSIISTIVPPNEIGKVFSMTTSLEAISNLAASPLYTFVYESTYKKFSGAFFLITTLVYAFNICLALYTVAMKKIRESLINTYTLIRDD